MQMQQCPHCGAAVPAGDRFCGECGRPLDAATAAPSTPAQADRPVQQAVPPAPPPPAWQPPEQRSIMPPPVAKTAPATSFGASGTMAVLSVILGTIGLCTSLAGCGALFALAGIALGAVSLRSPQRTLAMIGIGISAFTLLITLAMLVLGWVGNFWQGFSSGF